jgi:endoglucanase
MNKILSQWLRSAGRVAHRNRLISAACGTALAMNASAAIQPITTQGSQVLFGGQPGSVSGMSLFWDVWGFEKYYTASTVGWLAQDWNAKLVRAAVAVEEGGSDSVLSNPAMHKARVKAVVDAAIAKDMYVIIDWHTHHVGGAITSAAISFFTDMAQTYKDSPNVIFEIFNEPWSDVYWDSQIKPYAVQVIPAIRNTGAKNLIIVGTRSWSQRVDEAAANRITGYENIAYTLHFYAGSHGQWLRDTAQGALNSGIPLFVTEWGSVNADGNGSVNSSETWAWVDFMKKNNLSNANWSVSDKAEGASALTPNTGASGWTSNQLTASGSLAKDIISHWPQAGGGGITPPTPTCSEVTLPNTIQAEAYCEMSGINTESTGDTGGGLNVGYIDTGDWMKYDVNVPAAGTYTVSYRVAAASAGGVIQLENAGGIPVYGTANVPATGGWQTWTTVSHTVQLAAGKQSLGIAAKIGGFNLNWIKVESSGSSSSGSSSSSSSTTPIATIQAESFSQMSGVQTEGTSDLGGGLNVGYIDAGDWLSYASTSVNIPETGTYTVEYRVASAVGGGSLSFEEAGGAPSYTTVSLPNTGGWQTWTTVKSTITLTAGVHKFGIKANIGGWNINWFSITQGVK